MGLNAGDLDREIVIQVVTKSQDPVTGEELLDWDDEDPAPVWAQWLAAGAKETWQAAQRLQATVDGVFQIYDRSPRPAPATHQVLFEGRVYDLQGVTEIGRGEGLELAVTAKADV